MHREDNSKYLLYIEPDPSMKSVEPIEDDLTKLVDKLMTSAIVGGAHYSETDKHDEIACFRRGSGFRGTHMTSCGVRSSNKDYLIGGKFITNSLAPYYVRYYRSSISPQDMIKLNELNN